MLLVGYCDSPVLCDCRSNQSTVRKSHLKSKSSVSFNCYICPSFSVFESVLIQTEVCVDRDMSCRFSVATHLWRFLFLLLLTTIVFYTFQGKFFLSKISSKLTQEPHEAAQVVNNAPPPPQCRPKQPTVYFVASSDTSTNFLFGTFYLLGAQISADFYLSKVRLVSPATV